MTSNVKKKLRYGVNIFLMMVLMFVSISAGQASVSTNRTIENSVLTVGNSTNVTVLIQNDVTQALSLQEKIPSGWNLTKISDDADQFKVSTNEWVWFVVTNNTAKTVKYKVTVPPGTTPGTYEINGNVTTSTTTTGIAGDNTIEVTNTTVADTIAPTTELSGVVEGGTYADNVTITLTATDGAGGSGVNNTTFSINGAAMTIYSAPFTVTNNGQNTITYSSVDNKGNVENIKTINFTINSSTSIGSFGFIVSPSSATVNVGEIAAYNLTLTNMGNVADIYNLVSDGPSNTAAILDKSIVNVGQGNSAVVELTVVGSATGTYIVNVTATSNSDVKNTKKVTTTTNVIEQLLAVDISSVPNSAIGISNPAQISANVKKGKYNITQVEFGIIDSNNLSGKGVDTILLSYRNLSGDPGLYGPVQWYGNYASMGNIAVSDIVTMHAESDAPGYILVKGTFEANNNSNGTEALLWFNMTTGNLSNVTKPSADGFAVLEIQDSNSTFQANISKFVNGDTTQEYSSGNVFKLYSIAGNSSMDNPRIISGTVPNGNYQIYAVVNDTNNSVHQLIDVNTIPVTTGSSTGSSGGGGGGGSGDGTYPTITSTPNKNVTGAPTETETSQPMATVTVVEPTTVQPVETVQETPIVTATQKSPGIGIVVAIGIIGTVYIIRRRK